MSGNQGTRQDAAFRIRSRGFAALLAAIVAAAVASPAAARHVRASEGGSGPAFEAIVLDAATGQVLRAANPDVPTYPASLTKMMTLYLTFEALNQGRLTLSQMLPVSAEASSRAPTKLGLMPGETVAVRDLILGLVTRSANDAATVLAEGLGGSEPAFVERMNQKARQLGMTHTIYRNPSGLPDPDQHTTARDMARIALALYHDFPREYRYFSTREFVFRGDVIKTHNHLLEWYEGADGIKTGYVHASGFNLAASAVRNGHRLVGIVMGGNSARSRDEIMANLLDQGFADVGTPSGGRGTTLIAAPAPQPAAAPASPPPAAVVSRPPVTQTPAIQTAAGQGDAESPRDRQGLLSAAKTALGHLSPVSRAEASTGARERFADAWGIQLGAFRSQAAAEHAVRSAASLPAGHGKQQEIVKPAAGEKPALYRARLVPFTPKSAGVACAALHKKKMDCTVVRPGARVASG
jgi:D-alanyl-D-alanine carboxypeptidase